MSSHVCISLSISLSQAPEQWTRPGWSQYGPVQGPDAGRSTAGDTGGMRTQTQNQHFSKKSCKRNFQAAHYLVSCVFIYICAFARCFIQSTFWPCNYVAGTVAVGSRLEFVFTNVVHWCWDLVLRTISHTNRTLTQLAWFSAHYMSQSWWRSLELIKGRVMLSVGAREEARISSFDGSQLESFPAPLSCRGLSASTTSCLSRAYTRCHL